MSIPLGLFCLFKKPNNPANPLYLGDILAIGQQVETLRKFAHYLDKFKNSGGYGWGRNKKIEKQNWKINPLNEKRAK
ncbi:hypothetical protein [Celerinatantimonas diazotrophica]|uniref:hypothetical protein n=1 Tax=Celerinatantimonas diazotrophica TaxID=412034 RepID=UPI00104F4B3D|nr:hypothetical protein [Celerinatantimonas diazotrophica]